VSVINARFTKPVDEECIEKLTQNHKLIVTMEENVLNGGFGEVVGRFVSGLNTDTKVFSIGVPNFYLEHGSVEMLKKECGLDTAAVKEKVLERYRML
jgi:1-deoxy-D-xylulose-5-phosphate synthase